MTQRGLEFNGVDNYVDLGDSNLLNLNNYFQFDSESGDMESYQGIADDLTYLYTIDTASIYKRNRTAPYSTILHESGQIYNIPGVNHAGDGCELDGKLYIATQNVSNPAPKTSQSIMVVNTSDLSFDKYYDVTAQGHNMDGVATDGTLLYVISKQDGSKIWKYNKDTGAYIGHINLTVDIYGGQGITYDFDLNCFYVNNVNGITHKFEFDGTYKGVVYYDQETIEGEGIEYNGTQLLVLNVYGGSVKKIQFINTAPNNYYDGYSIFLEFESTNNSGPSALLSRYNFTEDERQHYFYIRGYDLLARHSSDGTTKYTTDVSISENVKYKAVMVVNQINSSIELWLNGVLVNSVLATDLAIQTITQNTFIGQIFGGGEFFEGVIYQTKLYSRRLVEADMLDLQNNITPTGALVADYDYTNGDGTNLVDLTSNDLDGAISGATWIGDLPPAPEGGGRSLNLSKKTKLLIKRAGHKIQSVGNITISRKQN